MTDRRMGNLNRSTFRLEKDRRFVWNSKSLSVVAFLFPFLVLTFAYAALQTFPFGDRHILTVDLFHQYAPFLQLMRDKVLAGGSLFYSLSSGLGVNFYAIFARTRRQLLCDLRLLSRKSAQSHLIALSRSFPDGRRFARFAH